METQEKVLNLVYDVWDEENNQIIELITNQFKTYALIHREQ